MAISRQLRLNTSRPVGAGGFILAYVLGAVLFLSIIGLAILAMTMTATKVSVGMLDSTTRSHAIDSALEEAVSRLRFIDDGADATFAKTLAKCAELVSAGPIYTDPGSNGSLGGGTLTLLSCDVEMIPERYLDKHGQLVDRSLGRRLTLSVSWSGAPNIVGTAHVEIIDWLYVAEAGQNRPATTERIPGHQVTVCSWKLGTSQGTVGPGGCFT